ncbi:uncharacterized protein C8A04DRAFT_34038 [Dichotomopilus funicola]|uniref:Uncharacterized protein n=1 Tax=Dichotomopilus funicola TaxID=1934379 RepID=A0AAN6V9H8_9PEZI|nr:hypothetical protein C8A04DRAFT_34038 [Dichotomopilus funicola]
MAQPADHEKGPDKTLMNPGPRSDESPPSRECGVADLDGEYQRLLVRAINRLLSTELAEFTFAQILDGLPTGEVAYDSLAIPYGDHPIGTVHDELCPGMVDKLILAYRASSPNSSDFQTRLVELVAVAVHQIAALLFELDSSLHKDDGVTDWVPPKSDEYYQQYPRGIADMVGYWAESRIFGGVVLFYRRSPTGGGPEVDPNAIYLHPNRQKITYRIFQLLPDQRSAFVDFLLADDPAPASPFSILPDENNRIRVDPEEPIRETGIYRDPWERAELGRDQGDGRYITVWDRLEYPTTEDYIASRGRAQRRKYGIISEASDSENEGRE